MTYQSYLGHITHNIFNNRYLSHYGLEEYKLCIIRIYERDATVTATIMIKEINNKGHTINNGHKVCQ